MVKITAHYRVGDLQQPDYWTRGHSEADTLAKCCAEECWESCQLERDDAHSSTRLTLRRRLSTALPNDSRSCIRRGHDVPSSFQILQVQLFPPNPFAQETKCLYISVSTVHIVLSVVTLACANLPWDGFGSCKQCKAHVYILVIVVNHLRIPKCAVMHRLRSISALTLQRGQLSWVLEWATRSTADIIIMPCVKSKVALSTCLFSIVFDSARHRFHGSPDFIHNYIFPLVLGCGTSWPLRFMSGNVVWKTREVLSTCIEDIQ